jgi:hypothetical protein
VEASKVTGITCYLTTNKMDVQGKEITYTTQYQVLLLFINYLKDIKNPVLVDPIYATLICQSLLTGRKSSVYFQHLLKNKRFCRHLKNGKMKIFPKKEVD